MLARENTEVVGAANEESRAPEVFFALTVGETVGSRVSKSRPTKADELGPLRLDVPRRGHVLATVAETYGGPVRAAVAELRRSLEQENHGNLAELLPSSGLGRSGSGSSRGDGEMAAWNIVSMWVAGVAAGKLPRRSTLAEAEEWFSGGGFLRRRLTELPSAAALDRAEEALRFRGDADVYRQLLPYVLDPHGPGSRLSVMRDPATEASRDRKRAEGVFYTPADVAEYMVEGCLDSAGGRDAPTVLDPACGTGVFLRAALKELKRRNDGTSAASLASRCLFGVDIDPWPLDAAAFVLLADVLSDGKTRACEIPAALWRRLRLNLACVDALLIDRTGAADMFGDGARVSLSALFPALEGGPDVIVGNPPYADLGRRSDLGRLGRVFATLGANPRSGAEVYTAFLEQMIRLTKDGQCGGSLVLPLSVACNVGPQFAAARGLVRETAGRWRFAFFDRQPHALFGEDVKTRNAIVFWTRKASDDRAVVSTGALMKWRGENRAAMFENIRFTEFAADISAGIPKIEGLLQAVALETIGTRTDSLGRAVRGIGRIGLSEAPDADDRVVFVGPTAYNFLNVFLRPPRIATRGECELSRHPLHAVRCASREDALAVFCVLTSHLAYWWWHARGDGFHVSRRFVSDFPFGLDALGRGGVKRLCEAGSALWSAIRENPVVSSNRGRVSLAYTPNGHDDMRRVADELLASAAGLDGDFVDELQRFTARAVTAAPQDRKCSRQGENDDHDETS